MRRFGCRCQLIFTTEGTNKACPQKAFGLRPSDGRSHVHLLMQQVQRLLQDPVQQIGANPGPAHGALGGQVVLLLAQAAELAFDLLALGLGLGLLQLRLQALQVMMREMEDSLVPIMTGLVKVTGWMQAKQRIALALRRRSIVDAEVRREPRSTSARPLARQLRELRGSRHLLLIVGIVAVSVLVAISRR